MTLLLSVVMHSIPRGQVDAMGQDAAAVPVEVPVDQVLVVKVLPG